MGGSHFDGNPPLPLFLETLFHASTLPDPINFRWDKGVDVPRKKKKKNSMTCPLPPPRRWVSAACTFGDMPERGEALW